MLKIILFIAVSVVALSLLTACGHWGPWRGHGHHYSMNSSYSQSHDQNSRYS
jgi:hypothetical protein